jgi:hypothetical protein
MVKKPSGGPENNSERCLFNRKHRVAFVGARARGGSLGATGVVRERHPFAEGFPRTL